MSWNTIFAIYALQWHVLKFTTDSTHFCTSSCCFSNIQILNFLPLKSRLRSRSTTFAMIPFDGKWHNLQKTPTHFCTSSYHFRVINIFNFRPPESRSWSWSTIFTIISFDGKCQNLQNIQTHLGVQFLQRHHSMASVKIYKRLSHIFCTSSHHFRDINILNCLPLKRRSRTKTTIFAMTPFDGKCQNLQKTPIHLCTSSYHFRDTDILSLWTSN